MNDYLQSKLSFPESSFLEKKIYKKLILEHGECSARDKNSIRDDIDSITWLYTLKPSTVQIRAYQDETREYLEIAVIEVVLKRSTSPKRLAEIIHRAIPYPLMLIFKVDSSFSLSIAPKRFSQAEKGAIVAEEFFATGWIDTSNISMIEETFLDALKLKKLPSSSLLDVYNAWIQRFIAFDCARLTGVFQLESGIEQIEKKRVNLKQCHAVEIKITELRTRLQKESQFAVKVDLNTKIKQLERKLEQQIKSL